MRVFHKNTSPTVSLECLIHTHEPKENKIMSRFNGIIEVRDVFQKDIWVFSCPCTLGPDHTPLPKKILPKAQRTQRLSVFTKATAFKFGWFDIVSFTETIRLIVCERLPLTVL